MKKIYAIIRVVEPGNFKLFFKSEIFSSWEERRFENVTAFSFCPSEPKIVYWVRWVERESSIFVQIKDSEDDEDIEEAKVEDGVAYFD